MSLYSTKVTDQGTPVLNGINSGSLSTRVNSFTLTFDELGESYFSSDGLQAPKKVCSVTVTQRAPVLPKPSISQNECK